MRRFLTALLVAATWKFASTLPAVTGEDMTVNYYDGNDVSTQNDPISSSLDNYEGPDTNIQQADYYHIPPADSPVQKHGRQQDALIVDFKEDDAKYDIEVMENFLDTTYVPSIAQRRATHEEMDRPYDRPYSDYIVGGFQFTDLSQAHLYVATVKNQLHQQALGWRPARKDISISNRNENNPLFDTVLPDGQIRLTCTYEAVHFDARLLRWCTYIRALSNRGVYKIGCFEDPADAAYAHYVVLKDEHPRRKLKPPVSRTELFDYHAVHRAIERTLHSLPPRLE